MEDELIALGESYLSRMSEMTVLHEDPSINYLSSYYHDDEFGHVTCSTYRVLEDEPRLMAAFEEMEEEGLIHNERISERMRCWLLEKEDSGREVIVMRTLCPFMISNRIMFTC